MACMRCEKPASGYYCAACDKVFKEQAKRVNKPNKRAYHKGISLKNNRKGRVPQ